jgi:hypothetical protein
MPRITHDDDFRCDLGRSGGGSTFVRVVHEPSGLNRNVSGLGLCSADEVARELLNALLADLEKQGWRRITSEQAEPTIVAD